MILCSKHFPAFAESYMSEIQRLCCCLLFMDRIETSPYADLFSPQLLMETQMEFTKACCKVLGIAQESPLYLVVCAVSELANTYIYIYMCIYIYILLSIALLFLGHCCASRFIKSCSYISQQDRLERNRSVTRTSRVG